MPPLFVKVNEIDNVGIIVAADGVLAGAQDSSGLMVSERIPQSHKVALRRIEDGEPILRYGQTIGFANREIERGCWVREEYLDLPAAPNLDEMPLATAVPAP